MREIEFPWHWQNVKKAFDPREVERDGKLNVARGVGKMAQAYRSHQQEKADGIQPPQKQKNDLDGCNGGVP